MRRIVSVTAAALLAGAVAGCGGSKEAKLPDGASDNIGKPKVLDPSEKNPKDKKGTGLNAD